MQTQRFSIRIGDRSRALLRVLFGVAPDRAWVTVDAERVIVRFGRWDMQLATSDITHWRVEGPWHWITAIGVRRSLRHGDVSFAGSPRGGVRLDLAEPIKWTIFNVPAVYVGVDDLDGFVAALSDLGIEGEDARAR